MMGFKKWLSGIGKKPAAPPAPDPQLELAIKLDEMGLDLMLDGRVIGQCCVCEKDICWTDYLTIDEILKNGVGAEYCGGSPRCCP